MTLVHVDLFYDPLDIDSVDQRVEVDGVQNQRDHSFGDRLGQLLDAGADRIRGHAASHRCVIPVIFSLQPARMGDRSR